MDESMVMVCMQIITNTGSAKSSYIEAIQKAKKGDLGGAEISMNEGDDLYAQAHEVHTSLIQKEASGEKTEFSLILMHAEDQMASTEMPLRYNNDKQKKPLFSRGLSVCRLLFNSFSKLKIDENYKEKRRLFY